MINTKSFDIKKQHEENIKKMRCDHEIRMTKLDHQEKIEINEREKNNQPEHDVLLIKIKQKYQFERVRMDHEFQIKMMQEQYEYEEKMIMLDNELEIKRLEFENYELGKNNKNNK